MRRRARCAVIKGLDDFPADSRPNVLWVHMAFQVMVGGGMLMVLLSLWYWWSGWRRHAESRWLLRALFVGSPLGFLALEAGWFVTELGRQPWAIYHMMRTSDAVTPVSSVPITFAVFTVLYLALAVTVVVLLLRLGRGTLVLEGNTVRSRTEAGHDA
jgi:cytochrome d ubiquinol oxidase subunit I